MGKWGRVRQAMRGMDYSVQRHAKTLQIEYQMKKQKTKNTQKKPQKTINLGLYISSEPINSAHCLGVQEHHTSGTNASPGYRTESHGAGKLCVLAW